MLRVIPDFAANFVVEGVIPASSLGMAADAARLQQASRSRAAEQVEAAATQIEQDRQQAASAGYLEGYRAGLSAAARPLAHLIACHDQVRSAVLQQVGDVLSAALSHLDVESEIISRWCLLHQAQTPSKLQLSLPQHRQDLLEVLDKCPALEGVAITLADTVHPVLRIGALVMELDPLAALTAQAEKALNLENIDETASVLATEYTAALRRRQNDTRTSTALRALNISSQVNQ